MRPREHQLETASLRAFARLLPDSWVFRELTPDYGIDGQLEIFDKAGRPTGLMCFVQLKASEKVLDEALAVRLRLKTLMYYGSLDLPLLMVVYHKPRNTLYAAWFDEIVPDAVSPGQKTITVRLPQHSLWVQKTAERVTADLKARRSLRAHLLPRPLRIRLAVAAPVYGVTGAILLSRLTNATRSRNLPIAFVLDAESEAHGLLRLEAGQALVAFAGTGSATLVLPSTIEGFERRARLHYDLLLMVAIALHNSGLSDLASRVIVAFARDSSLIGDPLTRASIVSCLVRARRPNEALALAIHFQQDGRADVANELGMAMSLMGAGLTVAERHSFASFLDHEVKLALENHEREREGTAHHNLAGVHMALGDKRKAMRHLCQAAKRLPRYKTEAHYWRHVGSALFNLRRFAWSAAAYERSTDIEADGRTQFLLADALMFAGEYTKAADLMLRIVKEELADQSARPIVRLLNCSEALISLHALDMLSWTLGVESQARDPAAADSTAPDSHELPLATRRAQALRALERDAVLFQNSA